MLLLQRVHRQRRARLERQRLRNRLLHPRVLSPLRQRRRGIRLLRSLRGRFLPLGIRR